MTAFSNSPEREAATAMSGYWITYMPGLTCFRSMLWWRVGFVHARDKQGANP